MTLPVIIIPYFNLQGGGTAYKEHGAQNPICKIIPPKLIKGCVTCMDGTLWLPNHAWARHMHHMLAQVPQMSGPRQVPQPGMPAGHSRQGREVTGIFTPLQGTSTVSHIAECVKVFLCFASVLDV